MTLPRSLAFYLPQFHPIAENDDWWGQGFTEWDNVRSGRPRFRGHYQPHVPAELGYYDLRDPTVRNAQAELAAQHGVDGFVYYHYWFHGRRLLQEPLDSVLRSGAPDFPFALCWANESWSRRWDGSQDQVLLRQEYSPADDKEHIRTLLPAFADRRYIRVDGKPLFLVYRASQLPDARRTTDCWRAIAQAEGVGDLHLCRVDGWLADRSDPRLLGFDAAVEFQPDWESLRATWRGVGLRIAERLGLNAASVPALQRYDYRDLIRRAGRKPEPPWTRYGCVTPQWDNSCRRRGLSARILTGTEPAAYALWLEQCIHRAHRLAQPLVFINAWNEWGEGCHLEPCQRWGRQFLEAHRDVVQAEKNTEHRAQSTDSKGGIC